MIICAYVVESAIASAGSDRRNYQTNKGTDDATETQWKKQVLDGTVPYVGSSQIERLSDTGTTAVIKIRDRF